MATGQIVSRESILLRRFQLASTGGYRCCRSYEIASAFAEVTFACRRHRIASHRSVLQKTSHVDCCFGIFGANYDVMRKTAMFLNSKFPHTTVQCLGWFEPERLAGRLPNLFPRALASWIAARCTLFVAITEDGSHEANAVRWSDQGQPVLDYDVKRLPHAEREHREAVRSFCRKWWANGRLRACSIRRHRWNGACGRHPGGGSGPGQRRG